MKNGGTIIILDKWFITEVGIKLSILFLILINYFINANRDKNPGIFKVEKKTLSIIYVLNIIWYVIGIVIYPHE